MRKVGFFLSSLLLLGCAQTVSVIPDVTDPYSKPRLDNVDSDVVIVASESKLELAGCQISLGELFLWRDWQPVVGNPGPDGGSPLGVVISLVISNRSDSNHQISWLGAVEDMNGELHQIVFTDRSQIVRRAVNLAVGEEFRVELVAHNGPYLPVDSTARLSMQFIVDDQIKEKLDTGLAIVNQTM